MKLRNTAILLTLFAVMLTGCGKGEQTASQAGDTAQLTAEQNAAQSAEQGKHHITVETVEISVADLKAQDYTVPVYVSLDRNAGVTYSEWGVKMDSRCTFTADNSEIDMVMAVYHSINDAEHFLWTAWASAGTPVTRTGHILRLDVKLPMSAAAGDEYTIEYADWSLADKAHIWSGENDVDWAENGDVTWTDGGIIVTE